MDVGLISVRSFYFQLFLFSVGLLVELSLEEARWLLKGVAHEGVLELALEDILHLITQVLSAEVRIGEELQRVLLDLALLSLHPQVFLY